MNVPILKIDKGPYIRSPRVFVRDPAMATRSPRFQSFKNPIFGVHIHLIQSLATLHSDNEYYHEDKKKFVLDALEELTFLNEGYESQLEAVLRNWRPKERECHNLFDNTAITDIVDYRSQMKELDQLNESYQHKIHFLQQELLAVELDTEKLVKETEEMKRRLFYESDHFSQIRGISKTLKSLQTTYDDMFIWNRPKVVSKEVQEMLDENVELKKNIQKLKYELEVTNQYSKRMRFLFNNRYGG